MDSGRHTTLEQIPAARRAPALAATAEPQSARWSLSSATRCGQTGYMRPCQSSACIGLPDTAFPLNDLCRSPRERVLVVEDDADLRSELTELLQALGYEARAFASAAQLREEMEDCETGCILLDILLPGQDGVAVQEWLNAEDITLPVIFVSGVRDIATVVQCMKSGAVEFLQKPFNLMSLRRAVNGAVMLSRKRRCEIESRRFVRGLLAKLTPTELQVAKMIARGYATKLIAAELGRSENTMKIHRHRIFEKLRVNSAASVANLIAHAE